MYLLIITFVFLFFLALRPGQLTVRNFLLRNFIISPQTGKYDLNVTWDKPFFNYSEILTYSLKFRVDRGNEVAAQTVRYLLFLFFIF